MRHTSTSMIKESVLEELIIDNKSENNKSADNESVNNESENNKSADNESVNIKSLKERIGNNTINLTNYNKHDSCKGRITGKALLSNKIKNLSIIDIDINKELEEETKEKIRNNILNKLSENDIIVKTASGGLHIYCNTDEFIAKNNRMVKCYKSNEFDIDIFSCKESDKRSLVVMAGSKVRDSNHKSPVKDYVYIRNDEKKYCEKKYT